jgi:Uma2 family endonuclease
VGAVTKNSTCTFEDFSVLVGDGRKADLIDGVIYIASPENTHANDLLLWLAALMRLFAEARDLGKVLGSRVALRLSDRNDPEPDILFVRKARQHLIKRNYIAGAADLAMEIVSPESDERDYCAKRLQYQKAGVLEYWIIDEPRQRITLLRLGADGKYREIRARKGVLHSQVLTGFWIRTEWLWRKPLPKTMVILNDLLA